jgi:PAS domain S-box-containing protein
VASRKILIVHDDGVGAAELEGRLVRLGYEVVGIVPSGADAPAAIARTAPELLLIEPRPEGEATVPATLRYAEALPAVFIIAESEEARFEAAGPSERHEWVVKPFSDRELRATVELALCRPSVARAVRAVEDRFFAGSIDLFCHLDFNGYFKRLNPSWERTLGFTTEELMSKPSIEFVHADDRERTLAQNGAVRGGGQALAFENRYMCKDGTFRWFRWNATPDSDEKVIYSVARDITASKQAKAERDRLVTQLQEALAEVRILREILPICSYCRKIRDEESCWHTMENYISHHTRTRFSHGICPTCMETEVEPQLRAMGGDSS